MDEEFTVAANTEGRLLRDLLPAHAVCQIPHTLFDRPDFAGINDHFGITIVRRVLAVTKLHLTPSVEGKRSRTKVPPVT